jgi:hypothetical protein
MITIASQMKRHRKPRIKCRNGIEYISDVIRTRDIVISSNGINRDEEILRQRMYQYLVKDLNVPSEAIDAEVPISRYDHHDLGRIDILIHGKERCELGSPLMIIELKAPNIPLDENHKEQAEGYANAVGAPYVCITNGKDAIVYIRGNQSNRELAEMPTYRQLLSGRGLKFKKATPSWKRPSFGSITSAQTIRNFTGEPGYWVYEDSRKTLKPFLVNLIGLFYDETTRCPPSVLPNGVRIEDDEGVSKRTYSNSSGGKWYCNYRGFKISYRDKEHFVVRIGFNWSRMLCAIERDTIAPSHSLQLDFDKYVDEESNPIFNIWHDGTLSRGRRGAAKRREVINYVMRYAPELIDEYGNVILGDLDNSREFSWENSDIKDFIGNTVVYSIVRDMFRNHTLLKSTSDCKLKKCLTIEPQLVYNGVAYDIRKYGFDVDEKWTKGTVLDTISPDKHRFVLMDDFDASMVTVQYEEILTGKKITMQIPKDKVSIYCRKNTIL